MTTSFSDFTTVVHSLFDLQTHTHTAIDVLQDVHHKAILCSNCHSVVYIGFILTTCKRSRRRWSMSSYRVTPLYIKVRRRVLSLPGSTDEHSCIVWN